MFPVFPVIPLTKDASRLPPQLAHSVSHPIHWHGSELADTATPLTAFGLALVVKVVVTLGATHAAASHGSCKREGAAFHSGCSVLRPVQAHLGVPSHQQFPCGCAGDGW